MLVYSLFLFKTSKNILISNYQWQCDIQKLHIPSFVSEIWIKGFNNSILAGFDDEPCLNLQSKHLTTEEQYSHVIHLNIFQ